MNFNSILYWKTEFKVRQLKHSSVTSDPLLTSCEIAGCCFKQYIIKSLKKMYRLIYLPSLNRHIETSSKHSVIFQI